MPHQPERKALNDLVLSDCVIQSTLNTRRLPVINLRRVEIDVSTDLISCSAVMRNKIVARHNANLFRAVHRGLKRLS